MEYLLGTALAGPIGKRLRANGTELETVVLCDIELASGLRSALLRKELSAQRATEALQDYNDLPLRLHSHRPLLERVWQLRGNFNAYDAAYVTLAERLNAEFLTSDNRLARSVRAHTSVRLTDLV